MGTVYEVVVATRPVRSAGRVAAHPPLPEQAPVAEPQEVETVSLEEADAEGQGARKPAPAEAGTEEEIEEEEVEMDETLDGDDTFIEEQEEEDADVTNVIGGNIENKEEA
jgi:hypothetical protein